MVAGAVVDEIGDVVRLDGLARARCRCSTGDKYGFSTSAVHVQRSRCAQGVGELDSHYAAVLENEAGKRDGLGGGRFRRRACAVALTELWLGEGHVAYGGGNRVSGL